MMVEVIVFVVVVIFIAFIGAKGVKNDVQPPEQKTDHRDTARADAAGAVPELTPFNIRVKADISPTEVKSMSGSGASYTVDIAAQTCTCPDFSDSRSHFEHGDARRFCKHMVTFAVEKGISEKTHEVVKAMFADAHERGWGLAREELFLADLDGNPVIISKPETGFWVNVYSRNRNPRKDGTYSYKRFGFNLAEQRWSYGYGPPGAKVLREIFSRWRSPN